MLFTEIIFNPLGKNLIDFDGTKIAHILRKKSEFGSILILEVLAS